MISRIREIYRYRAMLWGLVMYDLRTRYKGSILGGCPSKTKDFTVDMANELGRDSSWFGSG